MAKISTQQQNLDDQIYPLHRAIREFEDVNEIVRQNPDLVNYPDRSGTSPLQAAVRTRNQKAVEVLLANGADVNARARRQTCLEEAITLSQTRIAGLLLASGARPGFAFHAMGKAAAMVNKPYQLSRFDEDHYPGYRMGDPKWHDCMNLWRENLADHFKGYFEELAELLIQAGAEVNSTDGEGKTALFHAARNNYFPLIGFLLRHGANPDICLAGDCNKPIKAAVFGGNVDAAVLLLEAGSIPGQAEKKYLHVWHSLIPGIPRTDPVSIIFRRVKGIMFRRTLGHP